MSKQKKNNFRQLTAAALALLICAGYAPAVADVTGISFAVPVSAETIANPADYAYTLEKNAGYFADTTKCTTIPIGADRELLFSRFDIGVNKALTLTKSAGHGDDDTGLHFYVGFSAEDARQKYEYFGNGTDASEDVIVGDHIWVEATCSIVPGGGADPVTYYSNPVYLGQVLDKYTLALAGTATLTDIAYGTTVDKLKETVNGETPKLTLRDNSTGAEIMSIDNGDLSFWVSTPSSESLSEYDAESATVGKYVWVKATLYGDSSNALQIGQIIPQYNLVWADGKEARNIPYGTTEESLRTMFESDFKIIDAADPTNLVAVNPTYSYKFTTTSDYTGAIDYDPTDTAGGYAVGVYVWAVATVDGQALVPLCIGQVAPAQSLTLSWKNQLTDEEKAVTYGTPADISANSVEERFKEAFTIGHVNEVMNGISQTIKYYVTETASVEDFTPSTPYDATSPAGRYLWAVATEGTDDISNPLLITQIAQADIFDFDKDTTVTAVLDTDKTVKDLGAFVDSTIPATVTTAISDNVVVKTKKGTTETTYTKPDYLKATAAFYVKNGENDYTEVASATQKFEADKDYALGITFDDADATPAVDNYNAKTVYYDFKAVAATPATTAETAEVKTDLKFNGSAQKLVEVKTAKGESDKGTRKYAVTIKNDAPSTSATETWVTGGTVGDLASLTAINAGTYYVWTYVDHGTDTATDNSPVELLGEATIAKATLTPSTLTYTPATAFTNADTVPKVTVGEGNAITVGTSDTATFTAQYNNGSKDVTATGFGEVTGAFYKMEGATYTLVEEGTKFEGGATYCLGVSVADKEGSNFAATTEPIYSDGFTVANAVFADAEVVGKVVGKTDLKYEWSTTSTSAKSQELLTGAPTGVDEKTEKVWYAKVKVTDTFDVEKNAPTRGTTTPWVDTVDGLTATDFGTYQVYYYVQGLTATVSDSEVKPLCQVTIAKGEVTPSTSPVLADNSTNLEYIKVAGKTLSEDGVDLIKTAVAVTPGDLQATTPAYTFTPYYYASTETEPVAFDGGSSASKWKATADGKNFVVKEPGKYNVWYYIDTTNPNYEDVGPVLIGQKEVRADATAATNPTITAKSNIAYSTAAIELLNDVSDKLPEGCTLKFYTVERAEGAAKPADVPTDPTELAAFKANFKSKTEDANVTKKTDKGTYDIYFYVEGDGTFYKDSTPGCVSATVAVGKPTVTVTYNGETLKVGDAVPTGADITDDKGWTVGVKFNGEESTVDLGTPAVTVKNGSTAVSTATFETAGTYTFEIAYPANADGNWTAPDKQTVTLTVASATAKEAKAVTPPTIIGTDIAYTGSPLTIFNAGEAESNATIKFYVSDKEDDPKAAVKCNFISKAEDDALASDKKVLTPTKPGTYYVSYYVAANAGNTALIDGAITPLGSKTIDKGELSYQIANKGTGVVTDFDNVTSGSKCADVLAAAKVQVNNGTTATPEWKDVTPITSKTGDPNKGTGEVIDADQTIAVKLYAEDKKTEVTDTTFAVTGEDKTYYLIATVPESTYYKGKTVEKKVVVKAEKVAAVKVTDDNDKSASEFTFVEGGNNTLTLHAQGYTDKVDGTESAEGQKFTWAVSSSISGTISDYVTVDKDTGVVTVKKGSSNEDGDVFTITAAPVNFADPTVKGEYKLTLKKDENADKVKPTLTFKVPDTFKGKAPEVKTVNYKSDKPYTIDVDLKIGEKNQDIDGLKGDLTTDVDIHYYEDEACTKEVKDITAVETAGTYYAKVHVTANDRLKECYSDAVSFEVKESISAITITPLEEAPCVGETVALEAVVDPATVKDPTLTWSSSDPTIATVDAKTGVAKFLKTGEVTITATSVAEPDKKGELKLTVGAEKFTVSFALNGGTLPEGTAKSIKVNALPATLPTPTKDGYDFDAWYTDPEFTTKAVAGADVTEPTVLYANWIPQSTTEFTVKFDSNGGSAVDSQTVREGAKVKEPTAPTRTGYDFVEWQLDGAKYDFSTPVKGNLTLKAAWKLQTNTVTYMLGSTTLGTEDVAYGKKPVKAAKDFAEVAGKKITGWYEDEACTKFFSGNITEAKTLYAKEITNETAVGTIDGQSVDQMSNDEIVNGIGTAKDGVDITLANDLDAGKGLTGPKKNADSASIKINGDGNKINFSGNAKITVNKSQSLDIENAEIGTTKSTSITGAAGGTTLENVTINGKKATINSKTGDLTIGGITDKTEKGITVKGNKAKNATVDGEVKVASIGTYNTITVDAADLTVTKSLKASTLNLDGTLILDSKASATVDNLTGTGTITLNAGSKGFTVKKSLSGSITLEGAALDNPKFKIKVPKSYTLEQLEEIFDVPGYTMNVKNGTVTFTKVS